LSDSLDSLHGANADGADIHQRKRDHIALCHTGPVGLEGDAGLWGEVELVHDALPELALSEVDLRASLFGKPLAAPLLVTGMTGGPEEAGEINRAVARLCERLGLAFGVGSQRVVTRDPKSLSTFLVRREAPTAVILANIGVNQLRDLGARRTLELVEAIEADGLAVHLNPAMELAQGDRDADRDFRGGYEALAEVTAALGGRVMVKECGCGLSPRVVERLYAPPSAGGAGVRALDLSGVGGTSWVKLEALRARGAQASLGHLLAGWGVPTAAAVALAHARREALGARDLTLVASGGVGDPLTAAKALALGADLVGLARPLLRALLDEGEEGAGRFLEDLLYGLRVVVALTGSRDLAALRAAPAVLGPRLSAWVAQGGRAR